jgi:hypothetical protein
MKSFILLVLVAGAGWYGYSQYQQRTTRPLAAPETITAPSRAADSTAPAVQYKCDGRIHCSQMTSCAEATWFLRNCPGTKMDGDGDGVPCERQWCGRS